MNAREIQFLIDAINSGNKPNWGDPIQVHVILRALRLLAAAEANDGTTPETDAMVDEIRRWAATFTTPMIAEPGPSMKALACRLERERNGLAARVVELEPDAERYRWLRVQRHADIAACWYLPVMPQDYPVDTPEQRDAAIDAARGSKP